MAWRIDLGPRIKNVFDDLPPDLERLRTLRVWHALWLSRIDGKIALLERRKAEEEHGRRTRPPKPEWVVEVGIGTSKPPVQVHAGTCHMIGSRRRPVSRDEARRLLADGLRACTHCQPDTQLHIIDLEVAQTGAGTSREEAQGLVNTRLRRSVIAPGDLCLCQ
ncbi:DUF6233 domain-containing protein [Streptomyces canus]|uniref:DUF6233 domain-containing protein n=1 Tax=Streptomyces canus TaxID=58343 RepID=UPI002E2F09C9|nr:DUF6233 domain-containing protein [Streptomyces canus]